MVRHEQWRRTPCTKPKNNDTDENEKKGVIAPKMEANKYSKP